MEPAREVGGDFYDVLKFNDSSLLLIIADVMGKGMSASLLMASLQASSASLAHQADSVLPQPRGELVGRQFGPYRIVAPDGTVYTTLTNNPPAQGFAQADLYLVYSQDGGATWKGPLPVTSDVLVPTYLNTTFREGIVNTFAVGHVKVNGNYPLYVSWEDGSLGVSNIYLTASYDNGQTWTTPILVNDNVNAADELQPNLSVAPGGIVSVAFYDRRLACPTQDSPEAAGSGIALDPGTGASPGTPWGRANYCVNTAIQFYSPTLHPLGHNIRLSAHTWDPQLNAPHPSCACSRRTFIGDYFGNTSNGQYEFTTSVSTFNDGTNPHFYQQQVVARVALPSP